MDIIIEKNKNKFPYAKEKDNILFNEFFFFFIYGLFMDYFYFIILLFYYLSK